MKPDIQEVWRRIAQHEGEVFTQIKGKQFTYEMGTGYLRPSTTNQNLAKSQFEKALEYVPLPNTVPVQHLRGPSYLYAILMDDRIRQGDW